MFAKHVRSFRNLVRRPWRLQLLAIEAGLTLWFIRAVLAFVPFERWRHRLGRKGEAGVGLGGGVPSDAALLIPEIVWAVDRVSRRAPDQLMCLPRALAVCQMMERRGWPATLEIGVCKDKSGQFAAHAWVVHGGAVIIGSLPELANYVRLDSWPTTKGQRPNG